MKGENIGLNIVVLRMRFSLALSGFPHCVNEEYELLRDDQVQVFLSKDKICHQKIKGRSLVGFHQEKGWENHQR